MLVARFSERQTRYLLEMMPINLVAFEGTFPRISKALSGLIPAQSNIFEGIFTIYDAYDGSHVHKIASTTFVMAGYPHEVIFFEASSLNTILIINNYPYELASHEATFKNP